VITLNAPTCAVGAKAEAGKGRDTRMTAEEIQQEIERTREHLGETVDVLAAKADVKARARVKAAEVTARARDRATGVSGQVRQSQVVQRRWPLAVAAGILLAGTVVVWRWKRA
jgi:Protein of unknown function (DUF3618)